MFGGFCPPVMFRMNGIPTIARGEGVGMSVSVHLVPDPLRTQNQEILGRKFFEGGSLQMVSE